ncbi:hypothetical protein PaeBR_08320 [Paenibacillus sp. BR2-3]|uniref:hypothetical protein n=1 Tax=Paenibacillus sp. BR2-3 TaxID=3048494 RepID=UPI003977A9F9
MWPTPKASDGEKGGPNHWDSKGNYALPGAVHHAKMYGEGYVNEFRGVVSEINGEKIIVKSVFEDKQRRLFLSDFYGEGLKMEEWDKEPTTYEVPEEYLNEEIYEAED